MRTRARRTAVQHSRQQTAQPFLLSAISSRLTHSFAGAPDFVGSGRQTCDRTRVRYGFMERDFRARVEYTSPNLSTNLNPGQATREQTTVRSKTDSCHDTTTKCKCKCKCFGPVTQLSAHGTNHGAASRRPIFPGAGALRRRAHVHSRKPVRSVRATRGSAVGGVVPAQVTRKSRLPRESFSRWSYQCLTLPPSKVKPEGQGGLPV